MWCGGARWGMNMILLKISALSFWIFQNTNVIKYEDAHINTIREEELHVEYNLKDVKKEAWICIYENKFLEGNSIQIETRKSNESEENKDSEAFENHLPYK